MNLALSTISLDVIRSHRSNIESRAARRFQNKDGPAAGPESGRRDANTKLYRQAAGKSSQWARRGGVLRLRWHQRRSRGAEEDGSLRGMGVQRRLDLSPLPPYPSALLLLCLPFGT